MRNRHNGRTIPITLKTPSLPLIICDIPLRATRKRHSLQFPVMRLVDTLGLVPEIAVFVLNILTL